MPMDNDDDRFRQINEITHNLAMHWRKNSNKSLYQIIDSIYIEIAKGESYYFIEDNRVNDYLSEKYKITRPLTNIGE